MQPLLPGSAGPYRQTLPRMRKQVDQCVRDPFWRCRKAVERLLSSGSRSPSQAEIAEILFAFQCEAMGYLEDPTDMEMCKHPFDVMREIAGSGRGWGDCNNHAAFMAALAHSVRLPVFWAICTPEGCPEDQRHIYAALLVADDEGPYDDGDFLALDTGRRYPVFGRHSDLSGIATERTWTPAYMGAENYAQEAA